MNVAQAQNGYAKSWRRQRNRCARRSHIPRATSRGAAEKRSDTFSKNRGHEPLK